MAHMLGELTNDVYDLDALGGDADFIGEDGFGFMMLGVFVSIIPKVRRGSGDKKTRSRINSDLAAGFLLRSLHSTSQ